MAKKAPTPIDQHIGQRVRQARMLIGMSQEKLGDALGLTFQQVQKYEKGVNRIGGSRMHTISQILRQPVEWFYQGAPGHGESAGPAANDPIPAFAATRDGLELAELFNAIEDRAARRVVVDVARALAGQPHALLQAAE